jgi:hypothetical protein
MVTLAAVIKTSPVRWVLAGRIAMAVVLLAGPGHWNVLRVTEILGAGLLLAGLMTRPAVAFVIADAGLRGVSAFFAPPPVAGSGSVLGFLVAGSAWALSGIYIGAIVLAIDLWVTGGGAFSIDWILYRKSTGGGAGASSGRMREKAE